MSIDEYNKVKNKVLNKNIDNDYLNVHNVRFYQTLTRLKTQLKPNYNVCVLGGEGVFSSFLTEMFCDVKFVHTITDLRYPIPMESESFDYIINTEVLEHINDPNTNDIQTTSQFNYTGINTLLSECHRLLKVNHNMLLTTPNASSTDTMIKVLLSIEPWIYKYHVREFTPNEIKKLATDNGFKVMTLETLNSWNPPQKIDRRSINEAIMNLGFDTSNRGNNIFTILKKTI